ncbi:MAG: DnaJ C-terminal domain-containing protein [Gammaproteobacteria bacterium]|nr:DnaJ C-terminal domain-containing protein [Gammaproteobacteria bacterium]
MEYKDYYKILDVQRDASEAEIKQSYRRLARKYHPDVSKVANAEARFKELGEAYEVLKDGEKRKSYDQLGANWKSGEQFRPPPGWGGAGQGGFQGGAGAQGGFSDFFESVFGGGRGPAAGRGGFQGAGQDQNATFRISVEDAFTGAEKTIRMSGRSPLQVKIPAGIISGKKIRLRGQGEEGMRGGPRGDLYLEITVTDSERYQLKDKDIYTKLKISPWEAALGEKVSVATPAGDIGLKIPAASQTGRKMRLSGRGMPGKVPGNFYVELAIVTPTADSDEDIAQYQAMKQHFDFDPREE